MLEIAFMRGCCGGLHFGNLSVIGLGSQLWELRDTFLCLFHFALLSMLSQIVISLLFFSDELKTTIFITWFLSFYFW